MLRKLGRLLVIKKRWEAYAVIYALAIGATGRGVHYLDDYPGVLGWLLFAACTAAVFMAGAKILDATPPQWRGNERRDQARPDRRELHPDAPEGAFRPIFFSASESMGAPLAANPDPVRAAPSGAPIEPDTRSILFDRQAIKRPD
jgi:hypothetical protein